MFIGKKTGSLNDDDRRAALLITLRRQGIANSRVLAAVDSVPRAFFVEPGMEQVAWENIALAIPNGQTISQPFIVALMSQSLELAGSERVLEVGTGSGYQAAILARLAREVITVERIPGLAKMAVDRFEALDIHNVTSIVGDGSLGWEPGAPYDAIMVTAVTRDIPPALIEQLSDNSGRMVIPIARGGEEYLMLFQKTNGNMTEWNLGEVRFVPLIRDQEEH